MNTALQLLTTTQKQIRGWSWLKQLLLFISFTGFLISCFLFLTSPGSYLRDKMAETVIMTQHREWAWIFVGAEKRDRMISDHENLIEARGSERIDFSKIKINKNRSMESLVKVEDISGPRWKGKKIYVYDPTSLRVVVPAKQGEGERISSMVQRTGALAGINAGGFDDPDGLGNGFAPIGFIMSGGDLLYTGLDGSVPQHVVGFTDKGFLVIGKYSIDELKAMHVKEAVSFYPRIIANGVPLITSGDGGSGVQPRTALGQREDGVVIIVVIDGRQSHSLGATEKEVMDLFLEEGVINAGFLDGGASSELVLKDQGLVTKPSSRYGERRLPTGFLVFANPDAYKATRIWDGIDKINPGGAFDHPDFLREQAELRAKGLLNTPKPTVSTKPSESPEPKASDNGRVTISPSPGSSTSPTGSIKPTTSSTPKPTPSTTVSPATSASPTSSAPTTSAQPKPSASTSVK